MSFWKTVGTGFKVWLLNVVALIIWTIVWTIIGFMGLTATTLFSTPNTFFMVLAILLIIANFLGVAFLNGTLAIKLFKWR